MLYAKLSSDRSTFCVSQSAWVHARITDLRVYRYILNTIFEGVYLLDAQRRVTFWNQAMANATGISRQAAQGRTILDLGILTPEEWQQYSEEIEKVRKDSSAETFLGKPQRKNIKRPNGNTIPVEVTIIPEFSVVKEQRQLQGLVSIVRDLTLQEKHEQELVTTQLALLAHEEKNVLSLIKSSLVRLRSPSSTAAEREKINNDIDQQIELGTKQSKEMLEYAKAELRLEPFSVAMNLQSMVSDYQKEAKEKQIFLKSVFAADIPTVLLGDNTKFWQIFSNLISNALRYTPAGENRNVIVSVQRTQNEDPDCCELMFEVTDEGLGIAQEDFLTIFELGYRAQAVRHGIEGNGYGLAIVKRYVELFGGHISVESTLGKGSKFTVTLRFGYLQ